MIEREAGLKGNELRKRMIQDRMKNVIEAEREGRGEIERSRETVLMLERDLDERTERGRRGGDGSEGILKEKQGHRG